MVDTIHSMPTTVNSNWGRLVTQLITVRAIFASYAWHDASHVCWLAWRCNQMGTFPLYWPFVRGVHRSPVNSPHKGQWRGSFMFSLICAWTNGWVINRNSTYWERHRTQLDVTVMLCFFVWLKIGCAEHNGVLVFFRFLLYTWKHSHF